jgi:alcohol dehydrogenase (cytochrome c)
VYDVDGIDENVLAELEVDGEMRKVMIQANKNGFLYTVDRTDCSLIAAHPYVFVNWATHIDLETGRPALTDLYRDFLAGEEVYIWPSRGTNAVPIAFNPDTGLIYATTWHVPRIQRLLPEPQEFVLGASSTGVTNRFPVVEPGDLLGHIVAIDPLTGEKKWEIPMHDFPSSAGVLATGGGLLFTGKITGEFVALDEETGETLWEFQTGSSVNATAVTYTLNGRQQITVASGLGGGLANRYARGLVPAGGSMWTFALMPEEGSAPPQSAR